MDTVPLAVSQRKGMAMDKEPSDFQILLMALAFWAVFYPLLWLAMALF